MKKTITVSIALLGLFTNGNLFAQLNTISTIAGTGVAGYNADNIQATSAELNLPYGICKDAAGNIYIAEWNDARVRKITTSTGVITTVAGTGNIGYSGDGGQATDAEIWGPFDVKVDASGNLYIADEYNNRIREVNSAGIITTVAGNGTGGYAGGLATAAELNHPTGVALDAAGNIFIADQNNNRIREVNVSTGSISTVAGTGTAGYTGDGGAAISAELSAPNLIAIDVSGNLYFSEWGNNTIRKVSNGTGIITTIAGTGAAGYTGDGAAATNAKLNEPCGIALDVTGNIYIGDASNNVVREVSVSGNISTFAGTGVQGYTGDNGLATNAEFFHPVGLVVDNNGNLIIDDDENNVTRKVGGPLAVNTISTETTNLFIYPNPANNEINISSNNDITPGTKVELYNLMGQDIYHINVPNQVKNIQIETADLSNGIYLVKLVSADGIEATKKFEVVK
jgi:sugar lactone lactonase YvrE